MSARLTRGFGHFIICFGCAGYALFAQGTAPVMTGSVELLDSQAKMVHMGQVYSRTDTIITAGVDAKLEWVIEPGSYVKQGDVLVRMDTLPMQLQLAEQKAVAKRADINAEYFKAEWARLEVLSKSNSTSKFQVDQLRVQYELAVADREIAMLKQQQFEDQIARATVKAPFNGVVVERFSQAGTDVNRSDKLLKILDTESLEVRVYIPVKYLKYIDADEELFFSADDKTATGRVVAKIPSADPVSQTFEVRIAVPNVARDEWVAGEFVKVDVPIEKRKTALTVHRDALVLRNNDIYIMKVDADNIAHKIPVAVGIGNHTHVDITGSLAAGDKVALRGAEQLEDGQLVVINQHK
jgi:RND family efflux transporter MFP subunit